MHQNEKRTALCLVSGGLDSLLVVGLLREQGVEIHGLAFESPFFDSASARKAADKMGFPLTIRDFTDDIIRLISSPRHGFGACLNPCLDCHALMLKRAGDMMPGLGCSYICTGEVLNERPMSQTRKSLQIVARDSGYEGMIVRPLSALLLDPTVPEEKGWINRKLLLDLEGRSRKRQFALAKDFGVESYPTPSGGCKLTEPNYTRRLKDLIEHEGLENRRMLALLKIGRHFRISGSVRLIVGRDERENEIICRAVLEGDVLLNPEDFPGATALLPHCSGEDAIVRSATICAAYSDSPQGAGTRIRARTSGIERIITVVPALRTDFDKDRI